MYFPTRSEKREALLIQSAERGEFSRRDCLYLAEIRKLEKDGFTVHVSSPFDENRKLFNVTISWGNAYKNVIPYLVYSYTTGSINTFPESQISTFAQRLYVTAKRANTF